MTPPARDGRLEPTAAEPGTARAAGRSALLLPSSASSAPPPALLRRAPVLLMLTLRTGPPKATPRSELSRRPARGIGAAKPPSAAPVPPSSFSPPSPPADEGSVTVPGGESTECCGDERSPADGSAPFIPAVDASAASRPRLSRRACDAGVSDRGACAIAQHCRRRVGGDRPPRRAMAMDAHTHLCLGRMLRRCRVVLFPPHRDGDLALRVVAREGVHDGHVFCVVALAPPLIARLVLHLQRRSDDDGTWPSSPPHPLPPHTPAATRP